MNEAEWLASTRPMAMLGFLVDGPLRDRYPDARFRLFGCACLRWVWSELPDRRSRNAVETAERFALGQADRRSLVRANRVAEQAAHEAWATSVVGDDTERRYRLAAEARDLTASSGVSVAWGVCQLLANDATSSRARDVPGLIREVFGNPFHTPALPSQWRAWNGGTIPALSRDIHEGRRYAEMPVLADALEEAGCSDEQILAHCRAGGPHMPGCWVLELLRAEE